MRNRVLSFLLRECPFIKECNARVSPYTFEDECNSFCKWRNCFTYHEFKTTRDYKKIKQKQEKEALKEEEKKKKMEKKFKIKDFEIRFIPDQWKKRIKLKISDKELNALFEQPIREEQNEQTIETEETN